MYNVFARLILAKALSLEAGVAGLETGVRVVRMLQQEPGAGRILQIASNLGLGAYDATYLAAAGKLRVPLVTEDSRLLGAAPQTARPLAP